MRRLLLVTLLACSPSYRFEPPTPIAPPPAIEVNAPFERVWDAVIDYFAKAVIPVEAIEKQSGFIVASRSVIPSSTYSDSLAALALAECGVFRGPTDAEVLPSSAKYNAVVRAVSSDRTSLQFTIKFTGARVMLAGMQPFDCSSRGLFERHFYAAVKEVVER